MWNKLGGTALIVAGLLGLISPAATSDSPAGVLVAAADPGGDDPAPTPAHSPPPAGDPGAALYGVATTAVAIVAILIGGVVTTSKLMSGYFVKAMQGQVEAMQGQVDELSNNVKAKSTEVSSLLRENQDQTRLLLELRRSIAAGTACAYLRDDGSCSRLATPAPPSPVSIVLPVVAQPVPSAG